MRCMVESRGPKLNSRQMAHTCCTNLNCENVQQTFALSVNIVHGNKHTFVQVLRWYLERAGHHLRG